MRVSHPTEWQIYCCIQVFIPTLYYQRKLQEKAETKLRQLMKKFAKIDTMS